jgi:hypothetical protein
MPGQEGNCVNLVGRAVIMASQGANTHVSHDTAKQLLHKGIVCMVQLRIWIAGAMEGLQARMGIDYSLKHCRMDPAVKHFIN